MPEEPIQEELVAFIEDLLEEHGPDSQSAVGWFRNDAEVRYRVMLELVKPTADRPSLLDFGCGMAGLYDYIQQQDSHLEYVGLDMSGRLLAVARERHPDVTFHELDVLADPQPELPSFDYVVMNGIFTYRGTRSPDEMFAYLSRLVPRVWSLTRVGIAFNVHTPIVDFERSDLFHLPVDRLLSFLGRHISRHVVIRHDYGLYEYTAYVYRDPSDPSQLGAKRLIER